MSLLGQGHFLFERFARNFDLAVVNTIALSAVVRHLSAIENLRTVWWLHEAKSLHLRLRDLQGVQWERICALCVSDYAKSFVPAGIDVQVIYNGIPDAAGNISSREINPLTFILSGTIEPRKGQDIFVKAVALLPPAVVESAVFC